MARTGKLAGCKYSSLFIDFVLIFIAIATMAPSSKERCLYLPICIEFLLLLDKPTTLKPKALLKRQMASLKQGYLHASERLDVHQLNRCDSYQKLHFVSIRLDLLHCQLISPYLTSGLVVSLISFEQGY